jgi:hypothetical protein
MKLLTTNLVLFSSLGLLFLAACGQTTPETNITENPAPTSESSSSAVSEAAPQANNDSHPSQGGQVIETGPYHLEFVPLVEAGGTHLDFYLQTGDSHEAIPDAKVTSQIQLPNGEQKNLDFTYDAQGKHYTAFLPEQAAGEYKVVMQTDIKGEKVNGRFAFDK